MKNRGRRKQRFYEVNPRELAEKLGIPLAPNELATVQVSGTLGDVIITIEEWEEDP